MASFCVRGNERTAKNRHSLGGLGVHLFESSE